MKKLLGCFGTLALISAPTTSIVACQQKYIFDTDIWVVTDGGTVSDMSFNQSAWEGASKYVVGIKDKKNLDNWKQSNWRAAYFEAASSAPSDIIEGYKSASYVGAQTLILPGFNHGPNLNDAVKYANNIIYIDGSETQATHDNDKIIGIVFYAEMSGFLAGIAAAVYANAELTPESNSNYNPENYTTKKAYNFGTFGGQDNFNAVTGYMWGFLVATNIFNIIISGNEKKSSISKIVDLLNNKKDSSAVCSLNDVSGCSENSIYYQISKVSGKELTSPYDINKSQNVNNSQESWFTNSFQQGNGVQLAKQLLTNDNSNIIFPVAGPQTQDVIAQIKALGKTDTKIVGVDTDQRMMYGNIIITSALKQIANATDDALKNIYNNNGSWKGTDQTSKENPSWVGIAPENGNNNWQGIVNNNGDKSTTPYQKMALAASDWIRNKASSYSQQNIPFSQMLTDTFNSNGYLNTDLLTTIENALQSSEG